jgi:hypothetical protein
LIRALQSNLAPVWPMFDLDPSFPRYAWSNAATTRYEEWRQENGGTKPSTGIAA